MPVVARADKGIGQCVENARCLSSRALVEVTWILVQKRGQNCSANHNAGKAVCSGDSIPLTVPLGTLLEVWAVCRLAYAGYDAPRAVIGSVEIFIASWNLSLGVS